MLSVIVFSHLLGDYLFQCKFIARWKARSLVGVLVHGGIVTTTTLMCVGLVSPSWWPYALLIGLSHTLIDILRARFLRVTNPRWGLAWYLLDQLAHLAVILLVVRWSSDRLWIETDLAVMLTERPVMAYAIGYALLLNPAWVLIRFTVRGVWGPDAAPPLDEGEKYGPMMERVLIATCVLGGQFLLVPLVLLPRRLAYMDVDGGGAGVLVLADHLAETTLSVMVAVAIGLALRVIAVGG